MAAALHLPTRGPPFAGRRGQDFGDCRALTNVRWPGCSPALIPKIFDTKIIGINRFTFRF